MYGSYEGGVEFLVSSSLRCQKGMIADGIKKKKFAASPARNCHCWHVAGNDILPVIVLPSVAHGQAHWSVLYRRTGLCRCGRPGVCRVPENGRHARLRWVSMDVPGLWSCYHCIWACAALVAAGPTFSTGNGDDHNSIIIIAIIRTPNVTRKSCEIMAAASSAESPSPHRPRRADPLPRPHAGIPQQRLVPA